MACTAGKTPLESVDPIIEGQAENVVLVILDGIAGQDSFYAGTSRIFKIPTNEVFPSTWETVLPHATRIEPTWNTADTRTGPTHATLVTGQHVPIGQFSVISGAGPYTPEWPILSDRFQQDGQLPTDALQGLSNGVLPVLMSRTSWPEAPPDLPYTQLDDQAPDDLPFTEAEAALDRHVRLLIVNAHDADGMAHNANKDQFTNNIALMDQGIAALWQRIQSDSFYKDKTLLIVTADHGRHSLSDLGGWKNHEGDDCNGDRAVPLVFAGPNIPPNQAINASHDLIDITPSITELMGWPRNYAEGQPIFDGTPTTGPRELAGTRGEVLLTGTLDSRTEVHIDGQRVSTLGAREARGLSIVETQTGLFACWRELFLMDGDHALPYRPHCQQNGTDIAFPAESVFPYWQPDLLVQPTETGEDVLAAWVDNPMGEPGDDPAYGIRLSRFHSGSWANIGELIPAIYGMYPEVAITPDGTIYVAFSESGDNRKGRYNRQISVYRLGEGDTWEPAGTLEPDLGERMERGAFSPSGSAIAWVAGTENGASLGVSFVETNGRFQNITRYGEGKVYPGITPIWQKGAAGNSDTVWWVEVGPKICHTDGKSDPQCQDSPTPLVWAIAPGSPGSVAGSSGDGVWARVSL